MRPKSSPAGRLAETEVKLRATLNALPGLMFLLTSDGTFLDYHAADVRDLFVPPEQFIGKHVRDIMPPALAGRFEEAIATASNQQQLTEVSYSLHIDDAIRYFEARICPCGKDRVLSIVRDLTAQYTAEAALTEMQAEFDRASRLSAAGELAATVAHEVNQPLSAVLANASAGLHELQKDPIDRVELEEILSDIVRDAKRGTEIIQKIRDLFRSVAHRKRPVELNHVVVEAVGLTRARMESDSVHLELHLADHMPSVLGDPTELRQVMLNLIGNALDAMAGVTDRPKVLEIRSTVAEVGECSLTFRDCGSSIPAHELERIFDPFYTSKATGMGIGLSLCRAIVDAHHGTLRALPVDGQGALFEIRLPLFRDLAVREA